MSINERINFWKQATMVTANPGPRGPRHGPSKIRCPLVQKHSSRCFTAAIKRHFSRCRFGKRIGRKYGKPSLLLDYRSEMNGTKSFLRCAPVLHEWLHDHALACCNGWVPMLGCILPKYLWQHVYGIEAVQAWQWPTWNPVEHPPSTSRPRLININFMEKIVPNAGERHSFQFGRDNRPSYLFPRR